jgi:uncharacterized protein YbcV (DUF1398 family)
MFTIDQIKAAHAKVKSGADFPNYALETKGLGVTSYELYVTDGHTAYHGADGFALSADAKWQPVEIAKKSNKGLLENSLKIHQQGQTDFLTFCRQAAEAGVEKWIVDMIKMICVYYDKAGSTMVTESIPA